MKYLAATLLLIFTLNTVWAQDVYTSSGRPGYYKKTKKKKTGYDPANLVLGGGVNVLFGSGYADLGLSPIVGYRFTPSFIAGVGLGYQYFQQPDAYYSTQYTTYYDKENIIYPNIWARYFVWKGVYVASQLEYDLIKFNAPNFDPINNVIYSQTANVNATCLLVGAGIKQPLGGRAVFYVELMYDVLQQQYSPYLNTIIPRAGIGVGF